MTLFRVFHTSDRERERASRTAIVVSVRFPLLSAISCQDLVRIPREVVNHRVERCRFAKFRPDTIIRNKRGSRIHYHARKYLRVSRKQLRSCPGKLLRIASTFVMDTFVPPSSPFLVSLFHNKV